MKGYTEPDRSVWPEGDPRRTMEFATHDFRGQYNEWMPPEQPAIENADLGFNILESPLAAAVQSVGGYALDIGCGNGRFLVTLAKRGHVEGGLGIDVSNRMVDNAWDSAKNNGVNHRLDFRSIAIEDFDLWPPSVDAIIATEVLEHIFYLRDTLWSISGWLSKNGVFVGTVPLEHTCDAVVHLHYFTRDSLYELLSDFFGDVWVKTIDVTGAGENHLAFVCRDPKRT